MKRALPGGFLLAIEGIDGAGKSFQAQAVARVLEERGLDVVLTREPTQGRWGRLLRESMTKGRLSPADELNAFLEDRKEHVRELIRPALAAGRVVITDRYYFSTVAYQAAGFDPAELLRLNEAIAIEPHLLALIDLDPAVSLARIGRRDGRTNEFETLGQLQRSRAIFLGLRKPYLLPLDGTTPPTELRDQILYGMSRAFVARLDQAPGLAARQKLAACLAFHGAPPPADPAV